MCFLHSDSPAGVDPPAGRFGPGRGVRILGNSFVAQVWRHNARAWAEQPRPFFCTPRRSTLWTGIKSERHGWLCPRTARMACAPAAGRQKFRRLGRSGPALLKRSPIPPPPSPFLSAVRGGGAHAPGAGVGGQRSHGWRSAADFRVSERPWRAAANVRRWGMGSPDLCDVQALPTSAKTAKVELISFRNCSRERLHEALRHRGKYR